METIVFKEKVVMKKILLMSLLLLIGACSAPVKEKETYPYGMGEKEWNELSVQDKARIRRDFYFYEKGSINFVNPQLEIEGKKELPPVQFNKKPAKSSSKDVASEE